MSRDAAIYAMAGVVWIGTFVLVALAVWIKKQESPEFSFLWHIRNLKISAGQYEKLASSIRIMMYLYAFLAGIESAKGDVSMAVTCGALFFGFQAILFWVKTRWMRIS